MPLSPGTRLGSYEVLSSLGAGGMGEVYRARDTRLNRDVALKILPEALAGDPDRLARFRREAQVLASLNHPNIAHLYGFEDADPRAGASHALVMELVEGPTLADRIALGPVPVAEALPIARQMAEALEAAHEIGIIHRDLKPANVKVRDDGTVKVLDFGLAKALGPEGAESAAGVSNSPTLTARATQMGTIIGTAAYMAPEQARGKAADRRADVWAFGVVLFELLTGRRAFEGAEISDVLAAVLRQEIDWSALPPDTPVQVRRLLRRCLEKDRRERLGDMSAARLELKDAASGATAELTTTPVVHERAHTSLAALAATAVVSSLIAGVGAWLWLRPAPSAPAPVLRASIALPPGTNAPTGENYQGPVAISATHVALVANPRRQLYLRPLASETAVPAPGAIGAASPFFSPDGQYLAFFSLDDGRLKTVPVAGGPTSDLCAVGAPVGGHWGPGNVIVFADFEKGVFTVPATGGTPTVVVPGTKDALAMEPSWLPDGRTILYSTAKRIGRFDLEIETAKLHAKTIGDPAPGKPILDGYRARFVAPGYLVLVRGTTIVGMPFDAARLSATGAEQTLVAEIARSGYDLSSSGSIVYAASTLQAARTFVWVDRKGNIEPTGMRALQYAYPRISPDNSRIVVDTRQDERDLWIWDIRQKTMRRLTFEKGQDAYAVWTADSKNIVYAASTAGAEENLTIRPADGTGSVATLLASPRHQTPYSLSRDGSWLVYRDEVDGEGTNVGLLQLKDRAAKPLLATRFNERNAEISPDGTLIAYQSDEGGGTDIYVRPFPNVNSGKVQVSSDGGIRPAWSRDGRELFFLTGPPDAVVIKSATRRAAALEFRPPASVLDASRFYFGAFLGRTYDVAADGRFLLQRVETKDGVSAPSTISLVLNWVEDLRKR